MCFQNLAYWSLKKGRSPKNDRYPSSSKNVNIDLHGMHVQARKISKLGRNFIDSQNQCFFGSWREKPLPKRLFDDRTTLKGKVVSENL